MQISVEKRDGLERCMTVELPVETFEQAVQNRLKNLARSVKLDGFRPGKVPLNVVKKRFGAQVQREAMEEAVQTSLYEAFDKQDLHPAGAPNIEFSPLEPGKGPKYTVTFEVIPDIKLADMASAKVETPVVEISDADVDSTIERIRGQRQEWHDVERAATDGDRATIDFIGKKDGVAFAGGEGKQVPVVLGANQFIADFEKAIEGTRAGDDKTFDASFPADYANKELAGETVQFTIQVGAVAESVLPEVNDEFAKLMGVEVGTVDAFRDQVKENMQRELKQIVREMLKTNVMDALLDKNPLDLPQVMINEESQRLADKMSQMLAQQGVPMPADKPMNPDLYKEQAVRRVSLGLIMSELVKQESLIAGEDKVRAAVEEIAEPYEDPQEIINHYYGDKSRLAEVEAMVLEQAVVDWVLEKAEAVEKQISFEEIMQASRGQGS